MLGNSLVIFGESALTTNDLLIIGTFLLISGYLAKIRKLRAVYWTWPEKEGMSEETFGNIVGLSVMLIGIVSYIFAVILLFDVPAGLIETAYYGIAGIIVIIQTVALKIS